MRNAIIIAGEICSGKDTLVKTHYNTSDFLQVDLGTLVRKKFQTQERIFNNNLEEYFVEEISKIIASSKPTITIVITGVRQPSLCKKIADLFERVSHIYLVVPREILKIRYTHRAAEKDAKLSFEEAIAGDESLGMKSLQNYLLTEVECHFLKSY